MLLEASVLLGKEEILGLIDFLEKPLRFHEDPVYSAEEKAAIEEFENFSSEFFSDLKRDGHIRLATSKLDATKEDRMIRFFKTMMNVSNKLVVTKEFNAEEQWFILVPLYCWNCEMIKSSLSDVAIKVYGSLKGKAWKTSRFMMMGHFISIMNRYRNGKHKQLFSAIDVDLRNSFVHGDIDFPNNEIVYHDHKGIEKHLQLSEFLTKHKLIAPLNAILFLYRTKIFADEIKQYAKKRGFL